ncbi:MAG: hypothetical protein Q4F11_06615 [Eubacteriales bacterium]|nr:hypothetical protein [Eubacteriales bacterium]
MTEYNKSFAAEKIIKHWIYWAQKSVLALWVFWLIYILVFSMIQGGVEGIFESLGRYAYMIYFFIFFSEYTIAMSTLLYHVPIAISFGSTRKEAYAGQQIALLFVGIECSLVCFVFFFAMDKAGILQAESIMYLLIIVIMFAGIAFGQFAAILMDKFGTKGVAMLLFSIIFLVGLFVTCIIMAAKGHMSWLLEVKYGFITAAIIASAALYAVMSLVIRKRVMSVGVRF